MALNDFVLNVRAAARLGVPAVTVDSPKLDAERIEAALEETDPWRSSRAVAGFDENDSSFLPGVERPALTDAVRDFREATAETPAGTPASKVAGGGGLLSARLSPLPHRSPWRVAMPGDRGGRLVESDLVLALSEPCATSWTHW